MSNIVINKQVLQIGTAIIWAAVLIGVSLLTESEQNKALDWELMWVIIGGFLAQNILLEVFIKNYKDKHNNPKS